MQSTIKKSAKHLAVLKLFTIFAVVSKGYVLLYAHFRRHGETKNIKDYD